MLLIFFAVLLYCNVCSGGWLPWADWSPCSVSCGGGFTARMRMCVPSPGSDCTTTWEVDAGSCNEKTCNSDTEIQRKPQPKPEPKLKPEPEVKVSDWSKCEEGRQWQYRKVCEEGKNCKREKQKCPSLPEWGEWSECESGWHFRERCDENFDCDWEEEECEMETQNTEAGWSEWSECDEGGWHSRERYNENMELEWEEEECENTEAGWSEWSECDEGLGIRSRERCTKQYGCEEEVENCEVKDLGEWGPWGPCDHGVKSRFKCSGQDKCTEEEIMECTSKEWSEWGVCKEGKQERTKCDTGITCMTEQRLCGGALVMESWSAWSYCEEGFQSRTRCNGDGDNCLFEERECGDPSDTEWSAWTKCRKGIREREKCSYSECELEVQDCKDEEYDHLHSGGSSTPCSHRNRMGFSVINQDFCVDELTMREEPMDMVMEIETVDWEWEDDILEPVSWEWEEQSSWDVYVL